MARELLADALGKLVVEYEEISARIGDGVTECLRRGMSREAIEARVARFAATCDPVPPQYVVAHAIDHAVDWHDWRELRWQDHAKRVAA